MCCLRLPAVVQEKSHCMQVKGFSPECVSTWLLRLPFVVHLYSHWLQLNGFSPVWTRMCLFRSSALVNEEAHMGHLWVFSPPLFWTIFEVEGIANRFIFPWWMLQWRDGSRLQSILEMLGDSDSSYLYYGLGKTAPKPLSVIKWQNIKSKSDANIIFNLMILQLMEILKNNQHNKLWFHLIFVWHPFRLTRSMITDIMLLMTRCSWRSLL